MGGRVGIFSAAPRLECEVEESAEPAFFCASTAVADRPNIAMSVSDGEAYGWGRSAGDGWGGGKAQGRQQQRHMEPLRPTDVQRLQQDPALQHRMQQLQNTVSAAASKADTRVARAAPRAGEDVTTAGTSGQGAAG